MTDDERRVDEQAIRAAWEGGDHAGAMTLVVDRYGDEVLGFLRARLGHDDQAAEAYADTLEKVWRGFPGFAWRSSARGWVYAIARNAMIDLVRGERRHRKDATVGDLGPISALVARTRTRTAEYRRTETKDRFRQLREALPEDDQTLLVLRVDRGLSWLDLAAVLAPDDDPKQAAARMRQRFTSVKRRLKAAALEQGLL